MSGYTKTIWKSGAAPGISADKLNKLETQYDCAKDDLDDHVAAADPHGQYLKEVDAYTGPTTQSDVTASRAVDTVYQNTTGKPMFVQIAVDTYYSDRTSSDLSRSYVAYADANATPTTAVAKASCVINGDITNLHVDQTMTFVVLPSHYYTLALAGTETGGIESWIESY